jgi:hypothetical protein
MLHEECKTMKDGRLAAELTRAELDRCAMPDVCPVPERVEGYWLGSAAQWRRRALAAEAALEALRKALRAV